MNTNLKTVNPADALGQAISDLIKTTPDFAAKMASYLGDKRGTIYPVANINKEVIALDNAALGQQKSWPGDFLYASINTSAGAVIGIRYNNPSMPPFPFKQNTGVFGFPIKEVYLDWAAQAGKTIEIWYGYGAQIIPPNQDIASLQSIINDVSILARTAYVPQKVTVGSVTGAVLAANAARKYLLIQNPNAAGNVFLRTDGAAAVADATAFKLAPGQTWEPPVAPNNAITGITDTGGNLDIHVIQG